MNIKKRIVVILVMILAVGSALLVTGNDFEEELINSLGEGTPDNPYMIYDVHDLQAMNEDLTAHYALANDIDASETSEWNDGAGFEPVGNISEQFVGIFDGQNYTILSLIINRHSERQVGLFGSIGKEGMMINVGLINNNIIGDVSVGGFVGINVGTLSNCHATGTVSGKRIGGLVGDNRGTIYQSNATGVITGDKVVGGLVGDNSGTVSNSYATGAVNGGVFAGGLVGWNTNKIMDSHATGDVTGTADKDGFSRTGGLAGFSQGTISNSFAIGDISGASSTGGLVGNMGQRCTIYNSYATGNVDGDNGVGGLVGSSMGSVYNSYATGNVIGNDYVGGLGGDFIGTVKNSYSTGRVSGRFSVGGLIGRGKTVGNTAINSFWDIDTSGHNKSNSGGRGKTTSEMTRIETFTNLSTEGLSTPWDFIGNPNDDEGTEDIWDIDADFNGGYPFLSWQEKVYDDAPSDEKDTDRGIPGFLFPIMASSITLALIVFHVKKR